jgi:glutaminase
MKNDHLQAIASSIETAISPFYTYLNNLHQKYQLLVEGTIADDFLELNFSNSHCFGLCATRVENQVFEVGDSQHLFPLSSLSRVFLYGLALEDWGREFVTQKVGLEVGQDISNSIFLEKETQRPYNPLVDAGAIVTTDLIKGNGQTERLKRILEIFRRYTGRELSLNMPIFLAQQEKGHRARAIAYLLLNFGLLSDRISESLDLYFQQGAIMVNSRDLAVMAATLANGGINPITGEKAIDKRYVQDVISALLTCGMAARSGEWTDQVGIPAQGSRSGGFIAVIPQKLGLGVFSPPLDERGYSIRGIKVCEAISKDKGLHLFNIYEKNQKMLKYIEQVNKITAAAAALENDTFEPDSLQGVTQRDDELGHLARVFLQMVEQVKVRETKLKQEVQELRIEIDRTQKDRQVSEIIETDAFQNLKQKLQKMKKVRKEKYDL